MTETPAEGTAEGADADPFASEILGPETTGEQSQPVAEDHEEAFESPEEDEQYVDKRAAVQELSDLFRQSEVENTPSFLVPNVTLDSDDDEEPIVPEPESKHRVEDDEDITRGLISRLIDGVKGL